MSELKLATELIVRDFEISRTDESEMTESEVLDMLSQQVAYMIEFKLDMLLSLMYRLDVEEHKINHALSPLCTEPANIALSKLILNRQKQRAFTKQTYKPTALDDEDWAF